MTDYATADLIKTYLRIGGSGDDTLLAALATRASRIIDDYCGRWFASRSETRHYDAFGSHITGKLLLLDADLLSLTALTNGDGAAISTNDVILRPINWPPYFGIALRQGSGLSWAYTTSPEGAISVEGVWGYSTTPPEPVVHAAVRLAGWLYRQRDTGGQAGVTAQGVGIPEALIPRDVRDLIDPYVRLRMRAAG